jgi:hypothetical protein
MGGAGKVIGSKTKLFERVFSQEFRNLKLFLKCGFLDLGSVVASFFQILLPWFLPLSSLSSHSHVCYLWLIVMSIFLHFCSTLTLLIDVSLFSVKSLGQNHFFPFPLHSKGTALGKHGSLLLAPDQ